jgi:hypothetical protein
MSERKSMSERTDQPSKPLSLMDWPLQHHLPLDGTPPMTERWISQEYTWASRPTEGFVVTHDKPEDHDGVQTIVFSRLWVETGTATWGVTGTTSTVERLVTEDLEAATFRPEEYAYPPRTEKAIAAEMFGRLGVPALATMGIWKQAHQLREGDTVLASENHEYRQPRTVLATTTDHHDQYWGPRTRITWADDKVHKADTYMGDVSWVVLAGSGQ